MPRKKTPKKSAKPPVSPLKVEMDFDAFMRKAVGVPPMKKSEKGE